MGILNAQAMFRDLDQFSANQFMRGLVPKVLSFALCVGSGKSVSFVRRQMKSMRRRMVYQMRKVMWEFRNENLDQMKRDSS